jgi:hypothetical protein
MSKKSIENGKKAENRFKEKFNNAIEIAYYYADFKLNDSLIEIKNSSIHRNTNNSYYIQIKKEQFKAMLENNVKIAIYFEDKDSFMFINSSDLLPFFENFYGNNLKLRVR